MDDPAASTNLWSQLSGGAMDLFGGAAATNPYLNMGKFALGVGQKVFGAISKSKEAQQQIGLLDEQMSGLQQSMRDLGTATEAKRDVGRGEFDTGVTQLGKQTSYGMEDITSGSQSAAKKSGLISGDHRAEQRRERTTEQYGAQIVKQEDAFSREMMAIDEMYSTEANKIDAQTKSLMADKKKLQKQDSFMENLFQDLVSA